MNALSMALGPTQNQAWTATLRTGINASFGGGAPPASGAPPGAEAVGAQQGVIPIQPNAEGYVPDLLGQFTETTQSNGTQQPNGLQIVLGAPSGQPVPGWNDDANEYPALGKTTGEWTLGDVSKLLGNSVFEAPVDGKTLTLADAVSAAVGKKDVPEPTKLLALKWLSASGLATNKPAQAAGEASVKPVEAMAQAPLVDPAIAEELGLTSVTVEHAPVAEPVAEATAQPVVAPKGVENDQTSVEDATNTEIAEAFAIPVEQGARRVKPDQNRNAAIGDDEKAGTRVLPDQNRNAAIDDGETAGTRVLPDQNRNAAIGDDETAGTRVLPDQNRNAAIGGDESAGTRVLPDQNRNAAIGDGESAGKRVLPDQNRNAAIEPSDEGGEKVQPDQNRHAAADGTKVKPDQTRGAASTVSDGGENRISGAKPKGEASEAAGIEAKSAPVEVAAHAQAVAATVKPEADQSKAKLDVETAQRVTRRTSETLDALISSRRPAAVTVRLSPADLGEIVVKVKAFGPRFDAEIQASNEQVHDALQQNRAELVQTVQSRGLTVGSLDVTHEAPSQTTGQGASQQQASQQQSAKQDYERLNNVWMAQERNWVATETTMAYGAAARGAVDYLA